MDSIHTLAVVVAAGRSSRMGGAERKPFLTLDGIPVLLHTLRALGQAPGISAVVVVVHQEDRERTEAILRGTSEGQRVVAVVPGGQERIDSVRCGVLAAGGEADWILVHDGARPLVTGARVEEVIQSARTHGAALLAVPVADTLKRSLDGRLAKSTVERAGLWRAQTPQAFEGVRFRRALEQARSEGFVPTDDAALWEHYVGPIAIVPGLPENLKITHPEDLEFAQAILRGRSQSK